MVKPARLPAQVGIADRSFEQGFPILNPATSLAGCPRLGSIAYCITYSFCVLSLKQIAQCLGIKHVKGPARQRIRPISPTGGTTEIPCEHDSVVREPRPTKNPG
jgi:hypothetical protein